MMRGWVCRHWKALEVTVYRRQKCRRQTPMLISPWNWPLPWLSSVLSSSTTPILLLLLLPILTLFVGSERSILNLSLTWTEFSMVESDSCISLSFFFSFLGAQTEPNCLYHIPEFQAKERKLELLRLKEDLREAEGSWIMSGAICSPFQSSWTDRA